MSDSTVQTTQPPEQQLDALFAPYQRSDAPGVVVGIRRRGQMLYRQAFGMASLEHAVTNTVNTRMRIGSTSKQFAAMAAMLLVEDGKLDLDAGINKYVPDMPELEGYPSMRQLLNHTSGYRDVQEIAFNAAGLTVQPAGRILKAMREQSSVAFAPGNGQLYCNAGYYLASDIIARLSGISFEEFLQRRIFEPLDMSNTTVLLGDMQILPNMATLHLPRPDGSWRRGILVNEETSACGGIVTTIDDLLKWTENLLLRQRLGTQQTWEALLAPTVLNSGVRVGYGLGIYHHDYRGIEIIHHAGGVIGGNAQMLVVPDEALEIVIMTNSDGISGAGLALQALEILVGERLQPPTVPASSANLSHLFGRRYRHARGLVIGFDDVHGMLGVSAQLSPHVPILRDEGDCLRARWEDIGMGPIDFPKAALAPDSAGAAPRRMVLLEGGFEREFHLLEPEAPSVTAMAALLLGEYYSPDMGTQARIFLEGDALRMDYAGHYGAREMSLDPVSRDIVGVTCIDPVAPVRYPMTLHYQADAIVGFSICNTRARDLRFHRLAPRADLQTRDPS